MLILILFDLLVHCFALCWCVWACVDVCGFALCVLTCVDVLISDVVCCSVLI